MTRLAPSPIWNLTTHGLLTAACCAAIAVWRTLTSDHAWDVQLVYAFAIGMTAWLVIDVGRYLWRGNSPLAWPAGWRGMALVLAGVVAGFTLGITLGDRYSGRDTWGDMRAAPASSFGILALTTAVSVVASIVFYQSGRARAMAQQVLLASKDLTEARLRLLESQLDPHMLFNTLATLRALIPADPARAVRLLDHMGDFLRSTLQGSRATHHSLGEEFGRLRDYLEVMRARMGGRLVFMLDLPDALASARLPALLLQPLVENAIKHGLEPKVGNGHLSVRAAADGGFVTLTVLDDGAGAESLASLSRPGLGFGLDHVRERLATAYGDDASLQVDAVPGVGTRSVVRLPLSPQVQV